MQEVILNELIKNYEQETKPTFWENFMATSTEEFLRMRQELRCRRNCSNSIEFECLECGKVFRRRLRGKHVLLPACPACNGTDIDIH